MRPGDELCATLADAGVVVRARRTTSAPTGSAMIVVDDDAENTIVVDAGANGLLTALDDGDRDAIAAADVLLLQLEIPLEAVVAAARHARSVDTLVVLNAAPFRPLPDDLARRRSMCSSSTTAKRRRSAIRRCHGFPSSSSPGARTA